jgi:parallel beta helix pectate lyase-like protein
MKVKQHLRHIGAVLGGLLLLGSVWGASAHASTYYLSPTGSNTNPGTATAPWKTFQHAIPKLSPGDTLVLRNGTYTDTNSGYPLISCGTNAKNGTATAPITLRAESERQAHLKGTGDSTTLEIRNCQYWTVDGLRVSSADLPSSSGGHAVVSKDSAHLTFRRLLVHHNNRYGNTHLYWMSNTSHSLVEESEFYAFHRHAITPAGSHNNIFRRNYFHSRGHADLAGGYASGEPSRGDVGISVYPGSNNILENNIAEGVGALADIQAVSRSDNNQFLGNISLNNRYGIVVRARGASASQMPHDNTIKHFVAINSAGVGIYARGAKNTRCENCSALGGAQGMVAWKEAAYPGDGQYSFYADNALVMNASSYGIKVEEQDAWGINYANAYQNQINFKPTATDPRITNESVLNPQLGTCKVFIPATSPLKGAGKDGQDIGATVLYRYQNGVLTDQPLWEAGTGRFPCGAVVAGVNDVAGTSCGGVHQRLNVQTNDCLLPATYAAHAASASSPMNFRIVEMR